NRHTYGGHVSAQSPRQSGLDIDLVAGAAPIEVASADQIPDRDAVDPAPNRQHKPFENREEVRDTRTARIGVGHASKGATLHDVRMVGQADSVVAGSVTKQGADDLSLTLRPQQKLPTPVAELKRLIDWRHGAC